jgi:DNA-binding HxlR family transcriptional regulator
MAYKDRLTKLYADLNQHLNGIQLQFHQQQLQYFQQVLQFIAPQVEACKIHSSHLKELNDFISHFIDTTQVHEILDQFSKFLDEPMEDACRPLLQQLSSELSVYLDLVSNQTVPQSLQFRDFTELDSVSAFHGVIDPISNLKRLEILLAIQHGRKRFKQLESDLDLQAGHLIYHLNPLKNASYVIQDDKKNYMLTKKGLSILAAISQIQQDFHN